MAVKPRWTGAIIYFDIRNRNMTICVKDFLESRCLDYFADTLTAMRYGFEEFTLVSQRFSKAMCPVPSTTYSVCACIDMKS